MKESVEILSLLDRDRWIEAHACEGLPSQSWAYAWGLSASGVTPQLAVVQTGGATLLLPFLEREWMGSTDIATLQGLSGASTHPDAAAPFMLWREYATTRGWVCGYLQLSPFLAVGSHALDGDVVEHNALFTIDVTREDFLGQISRNLRRKIDQARKGGVMLVEQPQRLATALRQLYPASMRRLGAAANSFFTDATLERWALHEEALILGAEHGGEIQAVCLIRYTGQHAEAHLLGCEPQWRHLLPWFIWQAIPRLRAKRVRILNLGGAGHKGDTLYQFKERFNVKPLALRSLRQVYDRARYDELCVLAGVNGEGDYFPAYRKRPV